MSHPTSPDGEATTADPAASYICPGCMVLPPWEHRCCRNAENGRMCECPECINPTPADPGGIDLGLVGIQLKCGVNLEATCRDLIAAVEALRERWTARVGALTRMSNEVTELETEVEALQARIATDGLPCGCRVRGVEGAIKHGSETGVLVDPDEPIHECDLHKALRERVAALSRLDAGTYLQEIDHFIERTEAAEARVVELKGMLEKADKELFDTLGDYTKLVDSNRAAAAGLVRQAVIEEVATLINEAVEQEREACADIASTMDSARGNEQEIARAIRARTK